MSENDSHDPDDPVDPDDEAGDKRAAGFVPDLVRRAVLTGVGALFMTEEGIRNMVGEMKMPKEALGFLVAQADKTRAEVSRIVTQEVRRFLESETLRRELWKVLEGVTLEVNAQIQLKPSGVPSIKTKIRPRKTAAPDKQGAETAPSDDDSDEDEPGAGS